MLTASTPRGRETNQGDAQAVKQVRPPVENQREGRRPRALWGGAPGRVRCRHALGQSHLRVPVDSVGDRPEDGLGASGGHRYIGYSPTTTTWRPTAA